jgi:hypothetical protein
MNIDIYEIHIASNVLLVVLDRQVGVVRHVSPVSLDRIVRTARLASWTKRQKELFN